MTFRKFILPILFSFILGGCASVETQEYPVSYVNGLKIRYAFIDDTPYNRVHKMPAPFSEIRTVTIHNTAGYMSAMGERDRINNMNNNVSVSFHYAVDENEAVQLIPLDTHAWHAGDGAKGEGNLYSISIEICRSLCKDEKSALYTKSEENAVILAAMLLDTYNLPISALKKHQDWSGKFCPHRILAEKRWDSFKERVSAAMKNKKLAVLQ